MAKTLRRLKGNHADYWRGRLGLTPDEGVVFNAKGHVTNEVAPGGHVYQQHEK